MLADPQSITIGTTPGTVSLPAVERGNNNSAYLSNDGNEKFSLSHTYGAKRTRRLARVDYRKIAADPLISSQNIMYTASAYLVIDVPVTGFTVTEVKELVLGLIGNLTASTNANLIKFAGGES